MYTDNSEHWLAPVVGEEEVSDGGVAAPGAAGAWQRRSEERLHWQADEDFLHKLI